MVCNGSAVVNAVRAEQAAAVALAPDSALVSAVPVVRGADAAPIPRSRLPKEARRGKLARAPEDVRLNVFVQTTGAEDETAQLPGETARQGNLVAATVSIAELDEIARRPRVLAVELGQPLSSPVPLVRTAGVKPPRADGRRFGRPVDHKLGADVLIGIIDVQGFDFAHPDFLDEQGHTRWVRIWDQGGNARPSPPVRTGPRGETYGFGYGAEFRQEHLQAAIDNAAELGLPAWDIEAQSQHEESSHGTHVASIAAGNRGVCPRARLAGVLISVPEDDLERRRSFYDTTRLAHAVEYLLDLGDELGLPVSINVSLGTNGHAHDASAPVNRWIDSALAVPGRSVCVAAGNAGQEAAAFPGDHGYVMGRIHSEGRVPARGLSVDLEWLVVGNGVADISENELEIWYSAQDRFAVSVLPPGGEWIGPIEPRQFVENRQLRDGSMISIYNELYHPANGANTIAVYLSPFFSENPPVGIGAGRWLVRLHGLEVRDGRYHGWIERDDPRRVGRIGDREAWFFPSFFAERSNVDRSSVSTLACGDRIVSVANLDEALERINVSSSQGPTRDGRCKPEVAAPGTDVVAAKGFAREDDEGPAEDLWVSMTGTSMASPFVCGVVGLMLCIEPTLTAAQIGGILQRTSRPLPGADFAWAHDAGFGRIDAGAALEETKRMSERQDRT
jgi:subtilisin family serine protease